MYKDIISRNTVIEFSQPISAHEQLYKKRILHRDSNTRSVVSRERVVPILERGSDVIDGSDSESRSNTVTLGPRDGAVSEPFPDTLSLDNMHCIDRFAPQVTIRYVIT